MLSPALTPRTQPAPSRAPRLTAPDGLGGRRVDMRRSRACSIDSRDREVTFTVSGANSGRHGALGLDGDHPGQACQRMTESPARGSTKFTVTSCCSVRRTASVINRSTASTKTKPIISTADREADADYPDRPASGRRARLRKTIRPAMLMRRVTIGVSMSCAGTGPAVPAASPRPAAPAPRGGPPTTRPRPRRPTSATVAPPTTRSGTGEQQHWKSEELVVDIADRRAEPGAGSDADHHAAAPIASAHFM